MKSILVVVFVAVVMESISAQAIRGIYPGLFDGCGCGCGPAYAPSIISAPAVIPAPAIVQSSVAASLADTLSLLTVSSLLADTLPLGPNVVVSPCGCGGCGYGGCGCGGYGGCGCGGYGYGSIYY